MNRTVARKVRQRAGNRCEYCHLPVALYPLPFPTDHIIARQHGGETVFENLAMACLHCNRHKGPNIAGTDPDGDEIVRLFHPRRDRWDEHFEWIASKLTGRTAVGRATIQVLAINALDMLAVRQALIIERGFSFD